MDHTTPIIGNFSKGLTEEWEQLGSLSEMEQNIKRFMVWLEGVVVATLDIRSEMRGNPGSDEFSSTS